MDARHALRRYAVISGNGHDVEFRVNGLIHCLHRVNGGCGSILADNEDALIVNLLDSKLAAPNPDFLSYTLSKQALAGFTELSARALASKGIRVNGIAPALMLRSNGQSEENYERVHARNPLGRGVEPDDVVSAIRYFASARAVTGQVLVIDGGQHFSPPERDVQFL